METLLFKLQVSVKSQRQYYDDSLCHQLQFNADVEHTQSVIDNSNQQGSHGRMTSNNSGILKPFARSTRLSYISTGKCALASTISSPRRMRCKIANHSGKIKGNIPINIISSFLQTDNLL